MPHRKREKDTVNDTLPWKAREPEWAQGEKGSRSRHGSANRQAQKPVFLDSVGGIVRS